MTETTERRTFEAFTDYIEDGYRELVGSKLPFGKIGSEYVTSQGRRKFDVALSVLLTPAERLGERGISWMIQHVAGSDATALLMQERIGRNRRSFDLYKFRTMHPGTEETFGKWADIVRSFGVDELAQVRNVREGTMSFIGPRPILKDEYFGTLHALYSEGHTNLAHNWERVNQFSRPGMASSYANYFHTSRDEDPDNPAIRASLDVEDFELASPVRDMVIVSNFLVAATTGALR